MCADGALTFSQGWIQPKVEEAAVCRVGAKSVVKSNLLETPKNFLAFIQEKVSGFSTEQCLNLYVSHIQNETQK